MFNNIIIYKKIHLKIPTRAKAEVRNRKLQEARTPDLCYALLKAVE